MRKYALILWLTGLMTGFLSHAQVGELSSRAQFSVLTCGPGHDLYATFGHSAFRLRDPLNRIDRVYNYGTFDFNTPNFYMKFAKGQLPYALSKEKFENFIYTYQLENRWVREQLLDLSSAEKSALYAFLEENHKPENRFYPYDFLFENCATKIPEVLEIVLGTPLNYTYNHLTDDLTYRDLIQKNLRDNTWSSFGIDLALGSVIDRQAKDSEYSFLPEYVERQVAHASLRNTPLVKRERIILDLRLPGAPVYFIATPLFWLLLLLALTIVITWTDFKNQIRSRVLDFLLFFITGSCGIVIVFLWFFTDHNATQWNANILWAFPFNLILALQTAFRPSLGGGIKYYLWGLLICAVIVPLLWLTGIQVFSTLLIPILASLLLRYSYLIFYSRRMS